ncbi:hypothetical protein Tco_0604519 [Tanacetum coccineum]
MDSIWSTNFILLRSGEIGGPRSLYWLREVGFHCQVQWNSKRGPEFDMGTEVQFQEEIHTSSPRPHRRVAFDLLRDALSAIFGLSELKGKPQQDDTGFVDSGCSRHMTGNIAYLSNFKEFDGGYVTFGGGAHGGKITGKGTLKTDSLDFEDLPDKSQILLKIPRKDNMYSFDMKNIVPKETLTCLVAKATSDESML